MRFFAILQKNAFFLYPEICVIYKIQMKTLCVKIKKYEKLQNFRFIRLHNFKYCCKI